MRTTAKKLLCLLLSGLMLASVVAGTASCAKGDEDPEDTKTKQTAGAADEETEDPDYALELDPTLDYGKSKVSIIYPKNTNFASEMYSEKLTNAVVPDSVYERNLAVEEHLNVKLDFHESEGVINDLTLDIQGGLGDYQIVSNQTFITVPAIVEGKLLNLTPLDNLNLDKHYWTGGFNEMVTFTDDDMQFLASGALSISMYRLTYMTLYNKTLFVDNQIPDLYETVVDGKWTLDKQYSIIKDRYVDADHDGAVSSGDFFGFVTGNCVSVDPYMVATETHLIVPDPDTGDLVFNTDVGIKLTDVCDKIQLLYNNEGTFAYDADHDNTTTPDVITHFARENAIMVTSLFAQMEMNYADLAPLSYGIAPMPKFDLNQQNYRSYVQDQVTCFGISSVVGNPDLQERCAAVLEVMAYYSNKLVRPAYYDTALSERYMQDPQSKEILDIIFDTVYFDFASTCCNMLTVQPRDELRALLTGSTNTISSKIKVWQKYIKNSMTQINRQLNNLASQGQEQ